MRPYVRRLAAASAVAYLLAGWLASALHSHAGQAESSEAVCTTCSCGHHHHGEPTHDDRNEPSEPEHDHGCVVCQFLAQPPLAVAPVSLIAALEPISPAAEPVAPSFEAVAIPAWWSRGPPV
jgi:hypothetical protein